MTRVRFTANTKIRRLSRALGFVSAAALVIATRGASAQVDVFPPLTNVMLLVDTSGSMEFKVDGSAVTCNPGNTAQTNDRSRWVQVVESLSGTIQNYSCEELSRESARFQSGEYAFAGIPAYDYKYPVSFHRALSNGCGVRPGSLPTPNAFIYPASPVTFKNYSTEAACSFTQDADGILDSFSDGVRFGLMTFDTMTDPGTGHDGTSPNLTTGIEGTWSYIVGNSVTGSPIECTATDQEVGARNAAAPPWEGRMVNFGNPDRGALSHLAKAQQIEDILRATRPFGATPIAGMLKDAEDFFFNDDSDDEDPSPSGVSLKFGPKDDPYIKNGCRDQFIILLTDGQPNLDLRPDCEGDPSCPPSDTDCKCPFDKPEDIALRLSQGNVPVYVIGFALESFTLNGNSVTCADVNDTECDLPANASNRQLQACCSLERIAAAGKDEDLVANPTDPNALVPGQAIFVDSQYKLKSALSQILSANRPTSSRTQPVLSTGTKGDDTQRFYSSFEPLEFKPWVGHLERERYLCEKEDPNAPGPPEPKSQGVNDDMGDDFERNLASGQGPARKFYTYIGGRSDTDPINSRSSMRPYIAEGDDPDGLGDYGARVAYGTRVADPFIWNEVPAAAMEMTNASCSLNDADDCRSLYLKWLVGVDNGTDNFRCEAYETTGSNPQCRLLGDVMHSTPRVVDRPFATLRDETYTKFASSWALRPAVLYASSNDGFLHAFKTRSNDPDTDVTPADQALTRQNNELWAFIPPAILPLLDSIYPYTHVRLLDGAPVVKDVVALIDDNGKITMERTRDIATAGSGTWRTVLVQGLGGAQSGYFAIDVTDPVPSDDDPSELANGGPRFLWQLTLDDETKPLFGKGTVTPVITTLYFDSGSGASEVPVAVLSGGIGDVGDAGAGGTGCAVTEASGFTLAPIDNQYPARDKIKCYDDEYKAAQSLTIVRLDNGQIIRTFRRALTDVSAAMKDKSVVTVAPLDSPITGQPVAYPAETGAVADRIFVGDADGRVWKVDVSSTDPAQWNMGLFFDAYPKSVKGLYTHDWDDGQPIQTPTILSVDDSGQLTVAISTGDQDTAGTATGTTQYIWSLTESVANKTTLTTKVNWFERMTGGERVTGPMSLFAKVLYFSTFTPPGANDNVCNSGSSRLWGLDYIVPADKNPETGGFPAAWTDDGGSKVKYLEFANIVPNVDSGTSPTVFGVTIAQLPTCAETTTSGDDWLGYGTHTSMTNINPGKFELVVHTGTAGEALPGGKTNVFKKDLPTPPAFSQIDSWAALLE